MTGGARVLYLSYDGLTDNLGQSQVLPYLDGLSKRGHRITLLSCEKPDALAARGHDVRQATEAAGIDWRPLRYRKHPPVLSTLLDLRAMARLADRLARRAPFDIVHCRSYLPALVGLRLQRRRSLSLLFDMRGFWIDERFEREIWPSGHPAYATIAHVLRRTERRFFREADAIVSLTRAAIDRIHDLAGEGSANKVEVIPPPPPPPPCCVDLHLFDPATVEERQDVRMRLGIAPDARVLAYVGSVGGAYPLQPLFESYRTWRASNGSSRLLFISHADPNIILLHPAATGVENELVIVGASRPDVPSLLAAADAGACFILPSPAAVASSPTKLGEMLAMGLPVVANHGVGDTAAILSTGQAGVVAKSLATADIVEASTSLAAIKPSSAPRELSRKWFSLEHGIDQYDRLYRQLVG